MKSYRTLKNVERSTLERENVSSSYFLSALRNLERQKVGLRSLIVSRHGRIVYEEYAEPFTDTTLQRMYSCTKSFTSLAIGILQSEGRLDINDPVVKYFPEYDTENLAPEVRRTTIRNLLMMATPFEKTTFKRSDDPDWGSVIFKFPPEHEPGTVFMYDSTGPQTLTKLIERMSGMSLLDFLRSRFLDEIGFSKDAYIITDPVGVSLGGSGLMCTAMDMMKVMLAITADDFPYREYVEEATSFQIPTMVSAGENCVGLRQGYGYLFWRTERDAFCMYGMGGQLAICYPKEDMVVVTTGYAREIEGYLQMFFDLARTISEGADRESSSIAAEELKQHRLALQVLEGSEKGEIELDGSYEFPENRTNIRRAEIRGENIRLVLENGEVKELVLGLGKNAYVPFVFDSGLTSAVSGAYLEDALAIYVQMLEPVMGTLFFYFVPKGDRLTLQLRVTTDHRLPVKSGVVTGNRV